MISRRMLLALTAAGLLPRSLLAVEPPPRPLRILVLGGTRFIGRHIVEYALVRGHQVTLFNRGKSDPDAFPGIEQRRGDRGSDLKSLETGRWDAVIDTSGYVLRQVREAATLLAPRISQYLFISSISVYAGWQTPNDEDSPLATTTDEAAEKVTGENYGALKAACERAVKAAVPMGTTIVRPGYVVGPEDYTDRLTYWPVRVARGGDMAAPGSAADPVQFVDVGDLGRFCVRCLEQRTRGIFNAVHAPGTVTMGKLLETSQSVTGGKPQVTWIPAAFLAGRPELDALPIWSPPTGDTAADHLTRNDRALRAGLETTPLATTLRALLAWHAQRPAAERDKLQAGLTPEAERALLADWRAQAPGG